MSRKISQGDLRKLMAAHKRQQPVARIDNPLAKYTETGQLTCALCKSIVRSEAAWPAHVNSHQHKENVEEARRLKEQTQNFTKVAKPPKRLATPPIVTSEPKKIKGILKNSTTLPADFFQIPKISAAVTSSTVMSHKEEIKRAPLKVYPLKEKGVKNEPLTVITPVKSISENDSISEAANSNDAPIPEGFFDDPVLDAKARNQEYRDPVEEEWERFQRELRSATAEAAELVAGEQEREHADRTLSEIDEQMRNWSRVLSLEKQAEAAAKQRERDAARRDSSGDDDDDVDLEEFLDWRAKQSYT